ncbi:Male sterility domain protein [Streptomyces cellostaticus]|uniref:Male sterility domain protein n=1 Tax=Streptomyces cellostaticus TaxID=67285 RepID=A0A101NDE3_9ACTN|nr:SDR family oxidoreductase [Streptomyces cellostaticus]KUM91183.1 Male sterility domain protein [Streptomyces cellostaticus]GHI02744.1 ketoreductase [Streptomyces cellostaticus]
MILVTGASGIVGSALLRELDDAIALTHHKPVGTASVRGDVTRPWLGLPPADYRDLAARVDAVVHCAASVNFSITPEHLHRVNVVGTGHVLRFAEDASAHLVHGSTAFISRAGDHTPFGAYAASKAAGETLVRESGLPSCIARISTVIGDSHSGEVPRLQAFHYLLGIALSGQMPFLPCTPGTHVDLVPRDTVAAALAALARDHSARGDHWITAGPAALPMERIIDIASDASAARAQNDEELRDIDQAVFRTRLIDPAVADTVINAVLARSSTSAAPSVIQRAANLMSAYNDVDPFPTSLGRIPAGPAAPTIPSSETALRHMINYLVELPSDIWELQ